MSGNNSLNLPTEIPGLGGSVSDDGLSEFARGVLEQIPEEDRNVVSKYMKDWDGNVTKKFQEIHNGYKEYKDLGDLNDVREALNYIQLLNTDPVAFVKNVQEAMKEAGIMYEPNDPLEGELSELPEYQGLPKKFLDEYNQIKEELNGLKENFGGLTQAQQEKEEQAALDNLLTALHNEHGQFDNDWVLLQIARGAEPDEAVASFQEFIGQYSSSPARKPAPKLFQGAGNVPNNQVDITKMSREERKAFAIAQLQAANAAANQ